LKLKSIEVTREQEEDWSADAMAKVPVDWIPHERRLAKVNQT
jgi:hypothetical protein